MDKQETGPRSKQDESTESSWTTTSGRVAEKAPAGDVAETSTGRTTIAPVVVQKIARIATEEISGVYAMGGGITRAFGAIRERVPGASASQTSGVVVEVGEKQAAIDLVIVADYGAALVDLARAVRRNVITAIERMTGLEVVEVNIAVNDIHVPGEEEQQPSAARVE
ncbi:Asp23/Gls24 family envelope stress response protein [Saccharopolyspora sp. ASAGF58]|uniref:Asp23/Gls24 family envelope stress response protein n=1 Tax=Saccharopolyspora sp. ASAGF58 TaxID=2719023 RepID=UPI00143FECE2|nr:Asp23/Gls24 family envelope stress response protein [Saccharopolyspora sp. ASAGF58]QIZ38082.1 Asp23/Gls24 family envelope stress response protein [Saccharopolyspora sp. ASAGF58]